MGEPHIQTKGMVKRAKIAETPIGFGPCKIALIIPDHPGLEPELVLKSFVEDFGKVQRRAAVTNVTDIFEATQERVGAVN